MFPPRSDFKHLGRLPDRPRQRTPKSTRKHDLCGAQGVNTAYCEPRKARTLPSPLLPSLSTTSARKSIPSIPSTGQEGDQSSRLGIAGGVIVGPGAPSVWSLLAQRDRTRRSRRRSRAAQPTTSTARSSSPTAARRRCGGRRLMMHLDAMRAPTREPMHHDASAWGA